MSGSSERAPDTVQHWPLQSADGHRFDLRATVPADPQAALLFAPALGVAASYYEAFAASLAERGIATVVFELRGNGTSNLRPSRRVDFGYREILECDLPIAFATVRERFRDLPLYAGGHSLGGQLVMLHLAATRPEVDGAVLVACAIPYFRSWHGKMRVVVLSMSALFPVVGRVLGYVPGKQLGFGDLEARTLMRDWSHNARTARYEPIGSHVDYEAALRSLEVDLLTVCIEGDVMAPPEAVDFMFTKVPGARGRRVDVPLAEPHQAAHIRWAKQPEGVADAIRAWIGET